MYNQSKMFGKNLIIMFVCLVLLVAVSWFRFWFYGTPSLDMLPKNIQFEIVLRSIFIFLIGVYGFIFYRLCKTECYGLNLKILLVISVLFNFIVLFCLPFTSNDLFSYLAYGRMSNLGIDSNIVGVSALPAGDAFKGLVTSKWQNTPNVHGQITVLLHHLSTMTGNLWHSIFIYKFANFLVSIVITVIAYCYYKKFINSDVKYNSFVLFTFNPIFLWELSSQAHTDILMVLGILICIYSLKVEKIWFGLAGLLFAFVSKFAVLPVILFYFFYLFFNHRKHALILFVLLAVVAFLSFGLFYDKFQMILASPSVNGVDETRIMNTLLYLLYSIAKPFGLEIQTYIYKIFWFFAMGIMSVVGLLFAFQTKTKEKFYLHSFIFLFLFFTFASPIYQPWYASWLLPFIFVIQDKKLRTFFIIYSIAIMVTYLATSGYVNALINILALYFFIRYFWADYIMPSIRDSLRFVVNQR